MKFIIWSWGYHKFIGGTRVMHKLCHLLNELGQEAYITTEETNPEWNTPYHDGIDYDRENTVVIYPECFPDNKLDAKHVVRWILYHQVADYAPTDLVFKLHTHYFSKNDKCDGFLEVFDYDIRNWKNLNLERNNNMIAYRKGAWKKNYMQLDFDNFIVYDDYEKHEDEKMLCEVMNSCQTFICCDDSSFLPVQAVLCGCDAIVVPNPDINAEDYRKVFPLTKYGIAYGNSPNEIERAKYTKHLVKRHIEKINDSSKDSVKKFIEFWQNELEK